MLWFLTDHKAAPSLLAFIEYHEVFNEPDSRNLSSLDSRSVLQAGSEMPLVHVAAQPNANGVLLLVRGRNPPSGPGSYESYDLLMQAHQGGCLKVAFSPMIQANLTKGPQFLEVSRPSPYNQDEIVVTKHINSDYSQQVYRPFLTQRPDERDPAVFQYVFRRSMQDLLDLSSQLEAKRNSRLALKRALGHISRKPTYPKKYD